MTRTSNIADFQHVRVLRFGKIAIFVVGLLFSVMTVPSLSNAAPLIIDRAVADRLGNTVSDVDLFVEAGGFKRFRHGGFRQFNGFRSHRFNGFRGHRFSKFRGFGFKKFRGSRFGHRGGFHRNRFSRFH